MAKTIKISCKGSRMAKLDSLEIIQGDLKELSDENLGKLKKRIETKGFDAPFFVWQNMILDGTQRKRALESLIAEGWNLKNGEVPVCDIKADSLNDAKDRLLGYISQFGKITDVNLSEFIESIEWPDVENIEIPTEMQQQIDEITQSAKELDYREIELKPYKKTHVLLSFSPEKFILIKDHLQKITEVDGIEYEQASN